MVFFFNRQKEKLLKMKNALTQLSKTQKRSTIQGLQCRILSKRRLSPLSGNREKQDGDSHLGQQPVSGEEWNRVILPTDGEQGLHSGESTCLPPMWPGFDSRT